MSKTFAIFLSIVVGICLSVQPTINAGLGKVISPKFATLHSISTSAILMIIYVLFTEDISQYVNIVNADPLYWTGGIFGVLIVFFMIIVFPVLGASSALSIFIVVQLITGAIMSHFGVLNLPVSPLTVTKLFGILLMLIGVKLVL